MALPFILIGLTWIVFLVFSFIEDLAKQFVVFIGVMIPPLLFSIAYYVGEILKKVEQIHRLLERQSTRIHERRNP